MAAPLDPRHLRRATDELLVDYDEATVDADVDFQPIEPQRNVRDVAAVDGGSAVLLDVVSVACFAVRAAYTIRRVGGSFEDGPVRPSMHVVRRSSASGWWESVRRDHGWGQELSLPMPDGQRAGRLWADAARGASEFDAAMAALRELREGDILLLDGSLEDSTGAAAAVVHQAAARGIHVAAVSKDSGRSIGGTLPFPVELESLARAGRVSGRWRADITRALGLRGDSVRVFGARFGSATPVFRVDVPSASADDAGVWAAVAGACDDPTAPGYPYALARAHHMVAFRRGEAVDLQRSLESLISERQGTRVGMRLFHKGREVLDVRG